MKNKIILLYLISSFFSVFTTLKAFDGSGELVFDSTHAFICALDPNFYQLPSNVIQTYEQCKKEQDVTPYLRRSIKRRFEEEEEEEKKPNKRRATTLQKAKELLEQYYSNCATCEQQGLIFTITDPSLPQTIVEFLEELQKIQFRTLDVAKTIKELHTFHAKATLDLSSLKQGPFLRHDLFSKDHNLFPNNVVAYW